MIKKFVLSMVVCVFGLFSSSTHLLAEESSAPPPTIKVWKSASCGCCGKWVQHLKDNGFKVSVTNAPSMTQIKRSLGVSPKLRSCHTALVGDYVIEGHVPASDIKRLLAAKPNVKGLAVPGMPLGSPGMEMPGGQKDKYDVLSFDEAGGTEVFAKY